MVSILVWEHTLNIFNVCVLPSSKAITHPDVTEQTPLYKKLVWNPNNSHAPWTTSKLIPVYPLCMCHVIKSQTSKALVKPEMTMNLSFQSLQVSLSMRTWRVPCITGARDVPQVIRVNLWNSPSPSWVKPSEYVLTYVLHLSIIYNFWPKIWAPSNIRSLQK